MPTPKILEKAAVNYEPDSGYDFKPANVRKYHQSDAQELFELCLSIGRLSKQRLVHQIALETGWSKRSISSNLPEITPEQWKAYDLALDDFPRAPVSSPTR